ncbi:MAG: hypothetical protein CVU77_03465 [Elusimicrobia bacterium HGW-Elusimicrobia-1]|jgi:hypothetical protein|nr:MAG: hypothetical protein CVU77_03465 [Elusimicrobia bacterium HGW-Elusimicrobia-1]
MLAVVVSVVVLPEVMARKTRVIPISQLVARMVRVSMAVDLPGQVPVPEAMVVLVIMAQWLLLGQVVEVVEVAAQILSLEVVAAPDLMMRGVTIQQFQI